VTFSMLLAYRVNLHRMQPLLVALRRARTRQLRSGEGSAGRCALCCAPGGGYCCCELTAARSDRAMESRCSSARCSGVWRWQDLTCAFRGPWRPNVLGQCGQVSVTSGCCSAQLIRRAPRCLFSSLRMSSAARGLGGKRGISKGAPTRLDPLVQRRILRERQRGLTLAEIASGLNADEIPTALKGHAW
jgi:hypothetical protein